MLLSELLTPGTIKQADKDQLPNSEGTRSYFVAHPKPKQQTF